MRKYFQLSLFAFFTFSILCVASVASAQEKVRIVGLFEVTGSGAIPAGNFKTGVEWAVKEINTKGGLLGKEIDLVVKDVETNAEKAKALTHQAVTELNPYVIMGPVFSGIVMASMPEAQSGKVPQFVGGEATPITRQFNPYVFRTSFPQTTAMPKLARFMRYTMRVSSVSVLYIDNDFGKAGLEAMKQAAKTVGMQVSGQVAIKQGQQDYREAVGQVKGMKGDALFVYLNEDESARALVELRAQKYDRPILGETTLAGQKVIDLAGHAADGVLCHVGLTADAPQLKSLGDQVQKTLGFKPDHNFFKGYIGIYTVKAVTDQIGRIDREAFANALRSNSYTIKQTPQLLLDIRYEDWGDLDRSSFVVAVVDGKTEVIATLPPLAGRYIELRDGRSVAYGSPEARKAVERWSPAAR